MEIYGNELKFVIKHEVIIYWIFLKNVEEKNDKLL